MTQKQIVAALAKYPEIDAMAADFGGALASSLVAFKQANREIPPLRPRTTTSSAASRRS